MRWSVAEFAFILLLVGVLLPPPVFADEALPDTVSAVKPSIVGVGTMQYTRRPAGEFLGTGFSIHKGNHVVTSAHVVTRPMDDKAGEFLAVFVGFGASVEARRATLVALDREHDLAMLQVEGELIPPLQLEDDTTVREGTLLAFTGFPLGSLFGMYAATHRGIVASITPISVAGDIGRPRDSLNSRSLSRFKVYQLDATAYPGNSGSPVYLPHDGRVIGVVNKVFVRGDESTAELRPSGITYAIPVEYVHALMHTAGLAVDSQ